METFLQIKSDTKAFTRKLKLMEAFHDSSYSNNSIVKGKSCWEPTNISSRLGEIVNKIEHTDPKRITYKDNLNPLERNALDELKAFDDIVVKKADKGNTLVVMDRHFYRDKLVLQDHLLQDTYRKVTEKEASKSCHEKHGPFIEHPQGLSYTD